MRVRKLIGTAAVAMVMSSLGVYWMVPVGEARERVAADGLAEIVAATAETAAEAQPEPPASLIVEARVGHDHLDASGDRRTYVMVELRGKADATGGSMQTSTALVLDTSGSMAGVRMAQAEEAARRWVQRAPDGDVVTVIGFSERATDIVPRVELNAANRSSVLARLTGIAPGGDTCLSCGVERASATVGDPARIQRVIVLSDGQANLGIRGVEGVRGIASMCRDRGISVSTVGLGTGYNEKVLSALAFDANGLHHFVQHARDLPQVFQREESMLRATVASNVSANIDLAPGVQLVQVLDRQFRQTGQRITVDVGPIAAGASRTVLLEVRVPGSLGETPVANANVAFNDIANENQRNLERPLTTTVGDTASALDGLVAMRLERARTGRALQAAAELFAAGKKREALDLLDQRVTALRPRAVDLGDAARHRGDGRANDIQLDLQKQIDQANRARRQFKRAKPKARAPVKQAAPWAIDAFR